MVMTSTGVYSARSQIQNPHQAALVMGKLIRTPPPPPPHRKSPELRTEVKAGGGGGEEKQRQKKKRETARDLSTGMMETAMCSTANTSVSSYHKTH